MSVIPVGLQIGVETTSIVGALAKTAMRIGGVLMSDTVTNSGSDPRTEEQLVAILGRNCLDPAFAVYFRKIISPLTQNVISHFLNGLFLESGAGPAITQALASDDPGLLSAVAQVSFLAWFHDAQSLAQTFTQAITDKLAEAKAAPALGLNYTRLRGIIRAWDFWILKKCSCNIDPSKERVKEAIDNLQDYPFTLRLPKGNSLAATESAEVVLQGGDTWLFFLGGDGAARWLGANGFRYLARQETPMYAWYIRGRRCCFRCAVNFAKFPALILL